MGEMIYRIQDKDGRGPFKPGFSSKWVEPRPDHDNLIPWHVEMPDVLRRANRNMHIGCGARTLEQLRRWFTESEYQTLRNYGYACVQMSVDKVLAESPTQLIFERDTPLRLGVCPAELYSAELEKEAP